MIGSKITSSLHELESFQSMNNEEQLNKSLCSNKYTIRTECKYYTYYFRQVNEGN